MCAQYNPPIENLPIFDSSLFDKPNAQADLTGQYLQFPVAQGAETLKDTTIQGELLCLNKADFQDDVNIERIFGGDGEFDNLTVKNTADINIVKWGSFDPPISGVAEPINKVLQNGNNANNETLEDLGGLTMTGIINMQNQPIDNCGTLDMHGNIEMGDYNINGVNDLNFTNGDSIGQNSTNTIKFLNVSGVPFYLENGDIDGIANQQFKMRDDTNDYLTISDQGTSQIKLCSQRLLRAVSSTNPASGFGYILDSLVRPPMYKQIFYNINSSNSLSLTSGIPAWLMGCNIYPSSGDQVFNIGLNYAEILFSYFQINFTASSPFVGTNNCQLFLSNSPTPASYDPAKGNAIIFNVVNNGSGQPNYTFTSSIPIILYYQNGDLGTSFTDLYLNIQIQDTGVYTIALQNCNFVITAYIAGKNNETLVFGN